MENNAIRDDDEMEIDLWRMFYALRRKVWLIFAVALLFAFAAAGYTKFMVTPTYTSTSMILVLTKETTLTSLADLQLGSQLTKDYAVLIKSRPVLEDVIENLGLNVDYETLRENISIFNPSDTRILSMSVVWPDAYQAKVVVDELAEVASAYISDKMEVTPPKIIEDGEIPISKTSPSLTKNIALGFFFGMIFSAGIVIVFELLNDSIRNEDDIEKYLNLPVLAVVPDKDLERGRKSNKKKRGKQGKAI